MRYLGMYSAEMMDLLREPEQRRLEKFVALMFSEAAREIPVQRENPPLSWSSLDYSPVAAPLAISTGTKRIVIVTDSAAGDTNLARMTNRLEQAFSGNGEILNLHDLDIRGGCLGCIRCGYDNACVYNDGYRDFFEQKLAPADIIVIAGTVRDRYLSSVWKQFFDRSFYLGHTPGLKGKQIGFVIAGPLQQLPHLREALTAWAENGGCRALFVTDEVQSSGELDALLDAAAARLVAGANAEYIPPGTFYAVGGHKIFRDFVFVRSRMVFQADYRDHGMFDFPQGDIRTRLFNAVMIPLTRIPGFRKKIVAGMKRHMTRPFESVIKNARPVRAGESR